jgi:lysozyme
MAVQPTSFSDSDAVRGIDVSHHNGNIDWTRVASAGVQFCYAKATEGAGFKDIRFREYFDAAKGAGLLTGAYHFFRPEVDAEAQAESFLHVVSSPQPGDLPPVLDVEVDGGKSPKAIVSGIQVWLQAVENVLGHRPIIYTSASFWSPRVGSNPAFEDYMLWVAQYTTAAAPRLPAGFNDFVIWQFTEQGTMPGISGTVDLDRFHGTDGDLKALGGL